MKTIKQTILLCLLWIIGIGAYANQIIYTASEKLKEKSSPSDSGFYKYAFDVDVSSHTFSNGTGCITFYGNVTSIGLGAFYKSGITSITIPNSVTSIGSEAFGYSSLTSIEIPSSVTSIELCAFEHCTDLSSITIPNSVKSIGENAFEYCTGLTNIVIGNSVESIKNQVFKGCSNLTNIIVDSGNQKYDSRNNCAALIETSTNTLIAGCQNTVIPNSVESIGEYAFYNCSGLTSITIPNSVKSIGEYAFYGCNYEV